MIVYLVKYEKYDGDDHDIDSNVWVFANKEDAKKKFDELTNEACEDYFNQCLWRDEEYDEYDSLEELKDDYLFEDNLYMSGQGCYSTLNIEIIEKEVQ